MKNKAGVMAVSAAALAGALFLVAFMLPRMRHMLGGAPAQPPGGLTAITPAGQALAADPRLALPSNAAAQKTGDLSVALALAPYPPVSAQAAAFDVTLTDAAGQPITDATVTLDLTMPEMWMPSNKPTAQPAGNGLYHAAGRFTMRGLWWIEVIIERGGQKQSAFFSVWL